MMYVRCFSDSQKLVPTFLYRFYGAFISNILALRPTFLRWINTRDPRFSTYNSNGREA
jgi:hypothetical protein